MTAEQRNVPREWQLDRLTLCFARSAAGLATLHKPLAVAAPPALPLNALGSAAEPLHLTANARLTLTGPAVRREATADRADRTADRRASLRGVLRRAVRGDARLSAAQTALWANACSFSTVRHSAERGGVEADRRAADASQCEAALRDAKSALR